MVWNVHFRWEKNVVLFHLDVNATYLFRSNISLLQQIFFNVS